jgi:hypothetical protein
LGASFDFSLAVEVPIFMPELAIIPTGILNPAICGLLAGGSLFRKMTVARITSVTTFVVIRNFGFIFRVSGLFAAIQCTVRRFKRSQFGGLRSTTASVL